MLDGLFERFSLPDLSRLARRTVLASVIVAIVALVAALLLGAPLVGVGACIGVALGIVNFRLVTASVMKVGERQVENKRRPLAMNTLTRLGAISAITLALLFVSFDLGFGVLAGLAIFQVLLLLNVVRSMYRAGTQELRAIGDGNGVAGNGVAGNGNSTGVAGNGNSAGVNGNGAVPAQPPVIDVPSRHREGA